jgi:hypothetical protein
MSTTAKVSICVDCSTTIIGERPRCPACHALHAASLITPLGDDDRTVPRPRTADAETLPRLLARVIVVIEVLVIVVLGMIFVVRGCLS